jgi:hypothetical protein
VQKPQNVSYPSTRELIEQAFDRAAKLGSLSAIQRIDLHFSQQVDPITSFLVINDTPIVLIYDRD